MRTAWKGKRYTDLLSVNMKIQKMFTDLVVIKIGKPSKMEFIMILKMRLISCQISTGM